MTETMITQTPPPPDVLVRMAEAATDLHKYVLMEASWNGAVAKGKVPGGAARDNLVSAKDDLADHLEVVERQATFLQSVFTDFGPWFDEAVAAALGSDHLTKDQSDQLRNAIGSSDFAARGAREAQTLIGEVPKNLEVLRGGFDDVGGPMLVMSASTGCTMIDVAMMAGLALCIPSEGAGCVVALGAMIAHAAFC